LGKIEKLYLTGSLAKGLSTDIIDIVLVGDLNQEYLLSKIAKIENGIGKKIRYIVYGTAEAQKKNFSSSEYLLIYAP
jgi:predicted nucleotidyltransferase